MVFTVRIAYALAVVFTKLLTTMEYVPPFVGCTLVTVRVSLVALGMNVLVLKYH